MSTATNLAPGTRLRSIADGHLLAIVEAPKEPIGEFLVRFDGSAVMVSMEADELIIDYEPLPGAASELEPD
jgi:hypothetical protein